jgi:phosphoribosyl 1,2-cyclic phosphodiesterase
MQIKVIASGSSGNCYRVSDGKTSLLLEAGIPISKIKAGCDYRLSDIAACLISHEHGDHAKAAQALLKSGVDIYTSKGTADALNIIGNYHSHLIPPLEPIQIGTFTVAGFPVHHDAAEPFGYFIKSEETQERLFFVTDSYYIDYVFKGITHMMIEANYSDAELDNAVEDGRTPAELKSRLYRSHMSIETAVKLIEANKSPALKQVWLLHLSGNNANAEDFKRQAQECAGCEVYVA